MKPAVGDPGRLGFLASLDENERAALRARATTKRYRKGSHLFSEGDRTDHVVVILSGRVKVSTDTEDGREVVYTMRGEGELLGELSSLQGGHRTATVVALAPVEAMILQAADFQGFLEEHPRVALMLLKTVVERLRESNQRQIEFGTHDVTGRVCRRILELAERFGRREDGIVRVDMPMSQEELAAWVGSSREAVSKALGGLRARGMLESKRGVIIVHDMEALRRRAE